MKSYLVKQSKISGEIIAPPSKSHTLRSILFATMAKGVSRIHKYLQSPDTVAMLDACTKLGAKIIVTDQLIEITGVAGKPELPDDVINAGNSGQVLRYVASIAALIDGYTILTGDHSVRYNRPIRPLMQGLSGLGAKCISSKGDGYAPLIVKGPIKAGVTTLDGSDSQPVSGLLIASVFLDGATEIHVTNPGEKPWIGLTLSWFDRLGIKYENNNFEYYKVFGGQVLNAFDYTVPGDFSSIAYPLVAAIITQSSITISNLDINDAQGDKQIIKVLQQMGAKIKVNQNSITVLPIKALTGCEIDVNDMIDAVPILAVVGCYAKGKTKIYNASIARKKESDRLSTISTELRALGASIIEEEDSLTISGVSLTGASLDSHNDHRIAMSLTVAGFATCSDLIIKNIQCIDKSYPDFYHAMKSMGASIEVVS